MAILHNLERLKLFRLQPYRTTMLIVCLAVLAGCTTMREIRIHNDSSYDFKDVSMARAYFGDIKTGEINVTGDMAENGVVLG